MPLSLLAWIALVVLLLVLIGACASVSSSSGIERFASGQALPPAPASAALPSPPVVGGGGSGVIGVATPFGVVRTACKDGKDENCIAFDRYVPGNLVVGENSYISGDVRAKGSLAYVVDANATGNIRARGSVRLGGARAGGSLKVPNGGMDLSRDLVSGTATFRNGVSAGSLGVSGAGAAIGGGMSVNGGFVVGGNVSANSGAGWFQLGAGTSGRALAGADVLSGGNHAAAGGVRASSAVVAGTGIFADSCEVLGGPCAIESGMAAGSLALGGNMKIGRSLSVASGLTSAGEVVAVNGQDGIVVSRGGVSIGGEHPAAKRGMNVVRARGGGVTSFPVRGPSRIDGALLIDGRLCAGEACLGADDTVMINSYPATFGETLDGEITAFDGAFSSLSAAADAGLGDASASVDALGARTSANSAALAAVVREDKRIASLINGVHVRQADHERSFGRIDAHDTVQEKRIKYLEGRLDELERSTLSAMKESALEIKKRVNTCNGCAEQ